MSGKVLVGVGGSGQHVVHAYLRMLAIMNAAPDDVPHVYIIDADAKDELSSSEDTTLCPDIRRMHRHLLASRSSHERADFVLIRPFFHPNADSPAGTSAQNFLLHTADQALVDMFFTDDPGDGTSASANDRTIDLKQGMMANAKVGAISFGFKTQRIDDSTDIVNFGSFFNSVRDAHVAIVGSGFGGTGAGVIPALVRYLADAPPDRRPLSVRSFVMLRWFDIDTKGAHAVSAAAVQSDGIDPQRRNSALTLRTFFKELESARIGNANYVIAQPLGPLPKRMDEGNANQKEFPHVFNLVLATSIQHFLSQNDGVDGALPGEDGGRKLFGLYTLEEGEASNRFNAADSPHLRFRVAPGDNRSLQDIVLEAEIVALALEKGAEYIGSGRQQFRVRGGDSRPEPAGLNEVCRKIASLESKGFVKRGAVLWIGGREGAPDEVYDELAKALHKSANMIRESLIWLFEGHRITQQRSSGIHFRDNIGHLFEHGVLRNDATGEAVRAEITPASEQVLVQRWPAYGLQVESKQTKRKLDDKASRVAQAFTLLINCFYDHDDVSFAAEVNRRVQNLQGASTYDVVARLMTELVYKEVIVARAASRFPATDEQDEQAGQTSSAQRLFLRGVSQVETTQENSRLCRITRTDLDTSKGDVGTQQYQHPIQVDHPLSLRYLDPFLGVSNVNALKTAAHTDGTMGTVLLETALKGIPNVVAPLLVHRMRLERGQAYIQTRTKPPVFEADGERELRSSEYGIYLHARRIVEAAFWLAYTRDDRVEYVDSGLTNPDGHALSRLVNMELVNLYGAALGTNKLPRYTLRFAKGPNKGRVIFVNEPETGWALAATWSARLFLAEIMPHLPTVKYGTTRVDELWRGDLTSASRSGPAADSSEETLYAGFAEYLRSLAVGLPQDRNSPLWARAVRDIEQDVRSMIAGRSAVARVLNPETGLKLKTVGLIDLRGRAESQIRQPVLLDQISNLFVEHPVYFFEADGAETAQEIWPLRGSAWEHIDIERTGSLRDRLRVSKQQAADSRTDVRSGWRIEEISVVFAQLNAYTYVRPFRNEAVPGIVDIGEFSWEVAVWPSFKAPGWNYYIAGGDYSLSVLLDFDLQGGKLEADDLVYVYYGRSEDGSFGEIGRVEHAVPVKLRGIPTAVELQLQGRVLGSVPIELKALAPTTAGQTDTCMLAIDFGTSNTCLAYQPLGETVAWHLPILEGESLSGAGEKKLPSFTLSRGNFRVGDKKEFNHRLSPTFFFQSCNTRDDVGRNRSVPSELLFACGVSGPNKSKQHLQANASRYVTDTALSMGAPGLGFDDELMSGLVPIVAPLWTAFPPNAKEVKNLIEWVQNKGHAENFKWGSPSYTSRQRLAYRAAYLEQILVASCATLRYLGNTKISRVVATYPGAFEDPDRTSYEQDLLQVFAYVARRCGLATPEDGVVRRSETTAVLAATNRSPQSIDVTIDMGGGTTDIGVIIPQPDKPHAEPISYMSSVRYAGNHLMEAVLLSQEFLKSNAIESNEGAPGKYSLIHLKMLVRQDAPIRKEAVAPTVRAFFEALYEYVLLLVAAFANRDAIPAGGQKINLRLYGNGFRLAKALGDTTARELFEACRKDPQAAALMPSSVLSRLWMEEPGTDSKLDLVTGALRGQTPGDIAPADHQYELMEPKGHERVPIWLPCVLRNGHSVSVPTAGTPEERELYKDPQSEATQALSLDRNLLRASFPITSKYWPTADQDPDGVREIFNSAPHNRYWALPQFYLQGSNDRPSSFATVILPRIAKKPPRPKTAQDNY